MALKVISFEGQTNGTAATTALSDDFGDDAYSVSVNTGGTATYTTADAAHGTTCIQLQSTTASTATCLFDCDDAAASASFTASFYFKWTSYPTVTNEQMPVGIRSLSGALARLESNTTGGLRISMTGISSYTSSHSLNTWYRGEIYGTGMGTASTSCFLDTYVGDATGTPFASVQVTGQTTAAQCQRFRWGRASAATLAAMTLRLDSIRQNIGSSTPLGPWPTASTWEYGYEARIG